MSAAVFGSLHLFNPHYSRLGVAGIALAGGVLLSAAYLVTRSLWLPLGLHFGWNLFAGDILAAAEPGTVPGHGIFRFATDPAWLSGGSFWPDAGVLPVSLCLASAAVLLVIARRRGNIVPPAWRRGRAV